MQVKAQSSAGKNVLLKKKKKKVTCTAAVEAGGNYLVEKPERKK